jgi:transposase InsO family protein
MRDEGLRAKKVRRFKVTTLSNPNRQAPLNLLARDFSVSKSGLKRELNSAWTADITYLSTQEGWLYLAALIDLASRRIVGWSIGSTLEDALAIRALRMALSTRHLRQGNEMLHHSDRGSQYASLDYQSALTERGIKVSMSRKGDCWDNAVSESFFATLKTELVADSKWESRSQAKREVIAYLNWYNFVRRHSTLGYVPPAEYEMKMLQESSPAA